MNLEWLLTPQPLGADSFSAGPDGECRQRTFGGLLAAQALMAAAATSDGRPCHSLHLMFLAAGTGAEVQIDVERLRDGRSFSTRMIRLHQGRRTLVVALASFHCGDVGPEHQMGMPEVPAPEEIEDQRDTRDRRAVMRGITPRTSLAEAMLDIRPIELPIDRDKGIVARRSLWFRARENLGPKQLLHQGAIAFGSDVGLVHLGMAVHNADGDGSLLEAASLDHTIWFHHAARADDWLLHVQQMPIAVAGRGLTHGAIFARDGTRVASTAQEVLIRRAPE